MESFNKGKVDNKSIINSTSAFCDICLHRCSLGHSIAIMLSILHDFREVNEDDDERVLRKEIKKCTKSFGKCTVKQTATLRAWSEKNDLPVDKYCKQVELELAENDED